MNLLEGSDLSMEGNYQLGVCSLSNLETNVPNINFDEESVHEFYYSQRVKIGEKIYHLHLCGYEKGYYSDLSRCGDAGDSNKEIGLII